MNISDKIHSYLNCVDEELLPASMKEFVRSKTDKFNKAYSDVSELLNAKTTEEFNKVKNLIQTDPDMGIPLNSVNITVEGDSDELNTAYIKFGDLCDKIEDSLDNAAEFTDTDTIPVSGFNVNDELISRDHAEVEIDEVLKSLSDGIQELNAQEAIMNTLDECDPDDNSVTTSDFMSKISMFGANWSTKALAVCQNCLGTITSKGVSVKDKVRQLLGSFGLGRDDANDDVALDFVNNTNPMSGASPAALWGENLLQDIESIPINNYWDAMTAGWKALGKGLSHLFSGASKWIGKTCKRIANSTYKSDDFQVVDEKCKNYLYTNLGYQFYITDAASLDPAGKISSDAYTVFPFGYSRLYIRHNYDTNKFECVIKWCGAYIPDNPVFGSFDTFKSKANQFISRNGAYHNWSNEQPDYDLMFNQYNNLFENTPRDPQSDKEAMYAIVQNKRYFMYAATRFMLDVIPNDAIFKQTIGVGNDHCSGYPFGYAFGYGDLDNTTDVIPDWTAQQFFKYYMYGQRLPIYNKSNAVHDDVSDFTEPSNSDFQQELTHFCGLSSGITIDASAEGAYDGRKIGRYNNLRYVSGTPPTSSYFADFNSLSAYNLVASDFLIGLVKAICTFLNDQGTENELLSFYPYSTTFNGMEGRYEIKNDAQVADAYSGFIKTCAIVAAIIVISMVAIKVRIKAKKRYQDLSDEIQSKQYHRSEILGGAEPLPEGMTMEQFKKSSRKELRKLEKKKKWAAKLGGIKVGADAVENTIKSLDTKKADEIAAGISSEDLYEIMCGRRTI